MAILIKRYANRKLYNTETSRYITLKGIAKLLDGGEEVRVIDKETGDDITQVALSQILVDNKRAKEDPSDTLLTQILSRGGDALYGAIKKSVDDANDGLGDFQDRFRSFVSQTEAVAKGEHGFGWDPRSGGDGRSPFSDSEPGDSGQTHESRPDRDQPHETESDQSHDDHSEDSESRSHSGGWPGFGMLPDLREVIENAVQQSVARALTEVLDQRDLAQAKDLESLNEKLASVTQALARLERTLEQTRSSAESGTTRKVAPQTGD